MKIIKWIVSVILIIVGLIGIWTHTMDDKEYVPSIIIWATGIILAFMPDEKQ